MLLNEWVALERAKDINSVEELENRISSLEQHLMSAGRVTDDEALCKLLEKATEHNLFRGAEVGSNGLSVSHCQFVDDLINFVEAIWAETVKCTMDSLPTDYLGLPLGHTCNTIELCRPLINKFQKRLEGWKGRMLSFGSRITLLRSVFNNLHVYFMSLFYLPTGVVAILNKIMANFLWGSSSQRPIHWIKWGNIFRPRIFDVMIRNRALLNKRIWRYRSKAGSLWRKVIDAKYELDPHNLLPEAVNDYWTEVPSLKEAFPRIFSLAVMKEGKVEEFGVIVNG
ncbi:hypothetical protein GQ457_09G007620 [Hibiscus cannabinus]